MIALAELEEITTVFLEARTQRRSSRAIADWCEARSICPRDVLLYARGLTRSCLATIAEAEREAGAPFGAGEVESAIAAAIVTALQVGVEVEQRRRDARELPV